MRAPRTDVARREVQLLQFAASMAECPTDDLPEIALSGRSNVGKSSLVNLLTGQKKLAYISRQPGKTRVLTFYDVEGRFRLVDMPGYGYAKVGSDERKRWKTLAGKYFRDRPQLRAVIQLVDFKVGPMDSDRDRLALLSGFGFPVCIALTKADKVAKTRRETTASKHLSSLILPAETGVVMTSSLEKQGKHELWAWIDEHVFGPPRIQGV